MRQVDFHLMAFFVCLLSSLAFQMLKKKQIVPFWFIKVNGIFLMKSYFEKMSYMYKGRYNSSFK